MTAKSRSLFCVVCFLCFASASFANLLAFQGSSDSTRSEDVYTESAGLIVIEFESASISGEWTKETSLPGYSGAAYYVWRGNDYFGSPGKSVLSYFFNVQNEGEYIFNLRSYNSCSSSTECNDVWIRMDNGPWVKTFTSTNSQWTWSTNHEFSSINKIPASYNLSQGFHCIEFSGRSRGFAIDRMVFHKSFVDISVWQNAAGSAFIPVTDTDPPAEPGDISIRNQLIDGYELAWENGADNYLVKGYNVFSNSDKMNESIIQEPNFSVKGLINGEEYLFEVETVDWFDNISLTRSKILVKANFEDTIPPLAPPILLATAKDSSVDLSWIPGTDNFGGLAEYRIYVNDVFIGSATGTTFTVSGLSSGTKYKIGVSSVDAAGNESVKMEIFTTTTGKATMITPYSDFQKIFVYPNPAKDLINVVLPENNSKICRIEIMNINGMVVYENEILHHDKLAKINTENFIPGIYLIRITDRENVTPFFFIKE